MELNECIQRNLSRKIGGKKAKSASQMNLATLSKALKNISIPSKRKGKGKYLCALEYLLFY